MQPARVLILCTGNSARSQIAEALLRHLGGTDFFVASAGTRPRPEIHPLARAVLAERGIATAGQSPKDVQVFAGENFDYVITVCDNAKESCPVFPGVTPIHWSLPDPAEAAGDESERRAAFRATLADLEARLDGFIRAIRETEAESSGRSAPAGR